MDLSPQPDLSLLSPELRSLLSQAAQVADQRGWHIYLVGGVIRDLLYFSHGLKNLSPLPLGEGKGVRALAPNFTDIDLVVDSYHQTSKSATGVEVAQAMRSLHPEAHLEIYGDFQTAALSWHQDPLLNSLSMDIATARTESYPHPAANPLVATSSIYQDLQRRDFTINTLALRLTSGLESDHSLILDFFGGWQDLLHKQVRVLHSHSFIDDPTRIYRAVRFAVRLGFKIESQTEEYIRTSIASGIYQQLRSTQPKIPALQNRLKTEIKYLFQAPYYQPALKLLGNLQALTCLHPNLEIDPQLWQQVRLGDRLLRYLHQFLSPATAPSSPQNHPYYFPLSPDWLLRLELLLSALPVDERTWVANNLQLPADSVSRLQQLDLVESSMTADLPEDLALAVTNLAVSQLVERLKCYEDNLLLLTAIRSSRSWRRLIWQYLTVFRRVRSPLNGNDLKNLGYPPGKQYKIILEALTAATLDGLITDSYSAVAFLEANFPIQPLTNLK